ncbi:hypothetical protein [Dactylosporangium roseum]|uniref:hypothetical protein n=1 Tax=Dactylosporangium roseum TaxID=47989 RepID=UPI0031DA1316
MDKAVLNREGTTREEAAGVRSAEQQDDPMAWLFLESDKVTGPLADERFIL